jgi:hypothetical protein
MTEIRVVAVDMDRLLPGPRRDRWSKIAPGATAADVRRHVLRRGEAEYLVGNGTVVLSGTFDMFWPSLGRFGRLGRGAVERPLAPMARPGARVGPPLHCSFCRVTFRGPRVCYRCSNRARLDPL